VLPVLSMLLIGGFLLGGATLSDFALALFVGLILGTYSSIFLAAPVLAWLKERQPASEEYRRRQRRAAERAERAADGSNGSGPAAEPAAVAGPIAPRPRKKRRR
jgi:preprotein translocase subunit SecF